MLDLEGIKSNPQLLNAIDWEMTPEEAVRLYLEWGNNWARGNYVIRSVDDVSYYFVVNTWKEKPLVYLIRRDSESASELAKIEMPDSIEKEFMSENGFLKGVYSIEGVVKDWLKKVLCSG